MKAGLIFPPQIAGTAAGVADGLGKAGLVEEREPVWLVFGVMIGAEYKPKKKNSNCGVYYTFLEKITC